MYTACRASGPACHRPGVHGHIRHSATGPRSPYRKAGCTQRVGQAALLATGQSFTDTSDIRQPGPVALLEKNFSRSPRRKQSFFSDWRDMLPHVRDHGTKPEFIRETPGMRKPASAVGQQGYPLPDPIRKRKPNKLEGRVSHSSGPHGHIRHSATRAGRPTGKARYKKTMNFFSVWPSRKGVCASGQWHK